MEASQTIRVLFLRSAELAATFDHVEEEQPLLVGSMRQGPVVVQEYRSTSPGLDARIHVLARDDVSNIGCLFFTGRDRLEVAMAYGTILPYLPVELLEAVILYSPDAPVRAAALKMLGHHYAEHGFDGGDEDSDRTICFATRDPDPLVRTRAAAAALLISKPRGLQICDALLKRETDPAALETLRSIMEGDEESSRSSEPLDFDIERPALPRLAMPLLGIESVDDTLARFPECYQRTTDVFPGFSEDVHVGELHAPAGRDAKMTLLMDYRWSVGCAYFSGEAALSLVLQVAQAIRYLPPALARTAAVTGKISEDRARALLGLVLAESRRMLPGGPVNPRIHKVLTQALRDHDEQVRGMAVLAQGLLATELGALL